MAIATDTRRTDVRLHVTNGDAAVPGLRGTGLVEPIMPWQDALHEGPVPDVPDEELRRLRAEFLGVGAELFAERDRALEEHGEFVLWFESDLYDQLQLIQILARLRELEVPPERITLIVEPVRGIGELTSEELARLPGTTLTAAALEYAARAWAAFRAAEPTGLAEIVGSRSRELPFVWEAFDRLSREYPSTRDGLALTERRILAAVAAGATTPADVFARSSAREPRPFLGDAWCFDRMSRLAKAATPLLEGACLTEAGREVLEGRADHVALNGIDRWIGGAHLTGTDVPWRWDEGTETITDRRASAR
jgi:hypothetical protein